MYALKLYLAEELVCDFECNRIGLNLVLSFIEEYPDFFQSYRLEITKKG